MDASAPPDAPAASKAGMATNAFADRVFVVTGASRGLGRACAEQIGAAGGQVIALARTQGGLEDLDDAVRAAGGPQPVLAPADVTDGDGLDRLGGALFQRFGRVDGLIHAAGGHQGLGPLAQVKPDDFQAILALNMTSAFRLIRALDPLLRAAADAKGRADALFIADATPPSPPALWAPYAAAKAGLAALVEAYTAEVAASGVRAQLFTPPPMATRTRMKAFPGDMGAVSGPQASVTGAALTAPQDVARDLLGRLQGPDAP